MHEMYVGLPPRRCCRAPIDINLARIVKLTSPSSVSIASGARDADELVGFLVNERRARCSARNAAVSIHTQPQHRAPRPAELLKLFDGRLDLTRSVVLPI